MLLKTAIRNASDELRNINIVCLGNESGNSKSTDHGLLQVKCKN